MTAIKSIDEWGDNPVRPPAGELPEPMLQRMLSQSRRQCREIERLRAENAELRFSSAFVRESLVAKIESVRKLVCCYAGPRCDCKFGATGKGEQTGCPELRRVIEVLSA